MQRTFANRIVKYGIIVSIGFIQFLIIDMKKLITSAYFGVGVGICLFSSNIDFPTPAYFAQIPFWMFIVSPLGSFWNQKVLRRINEGQFPKQMTSYRQMILVSKKAAVYQIFLNQIGYHSFLALLLLGYSYGARTLYDNEFQRNGFFQILGGNIFGLLKLRLFFTCTSLMTEFWGLKMIIKQEQGRYTATPIGKRGLLLKEILLQMVWFTGVLKLFHEKYPKSKRQ